jgi:hypothetical protein
MPFLNSSTTSSSQFGVKVVEFDAIMVAEVASIEDALNASGQDTRPRQAFGWHS